MNALVLELSNAVLMASSESEGAPLALLLLGPAGAAGVYWGLYRYYRNTDKSHSFEKETLIESQPVTGQDRKVDTVRGTKRTSINNDNVSQPRVRVHRLG